MSIELRLTLNKDCVSVDCFKYKCLIEVLLHLMASRPDIMLSLSLCALFQENLKESHMHSVLRVFRYINITQYLDIWYPRASGIEVSVYAESDHDGYFLDRKSTSDVCTIVGACLTQWLCNKQAVLEIFTN